MCAGSSTAPLSGFAGFYAKGLPRFAVRLKRQSGAGLRLNHRPASTPLAPNWRGLFHYIPDLAAAQVDSINSVCDSVPLPSITDSAPSGGRMINSSLGGRGNAACFRQKLTGHPGLISFPQNDIIRTLVLVAPRNNDARRVLTRSYPQPNFPQIGQTPQKLDFVSFANINLNPNFFTALEENHAMKQNKPTRHSMIQKPRPRPAQAPAICPRIAMILRRSLPGAPYLKA